MIDIESTAAKAVQHFGQGKQTLKAVEEMNELSAAIMRVTITAPACPLEHIESVVEEIADVQIMITQLRQIYGRERVDHVVQQKLIRLLSRIEKPRLVE